jgi:membrane protease YdiL (CAAX protease family)
MFSDVKRTTWAIIGAVAVAAAVFVTGAVAAFQLDLFTPVTRATGGLINDTLVANFFLLAIIVGGIMFAWGKLGPRDVGLRRENLGTGVLMTAVLWLVAQVGIVAWQAIFGGPVGPGGPFDLNPLWQHGATVVIGLLVAQLLGNALYEEITFRGFLLPQLYLKLDRWRDRSALRLVLAVVLSVAMFALIHIPIRLWTGVTLAELPESLLWVGLLGVLFAVIYLRTGNLFFTVGAHALANAPTMLFVGDSGYAMMACALLIAALWPYAVRLGTRRSRGRSLPSPAAYETKGV